MKLYKNNVGRPSNETIKKRKMVATIVIVLILSLAFSFAFMLSNISTKNTKAKISYIINVNIGEVTETTVNFDWYINGIKGNYNKKYAKHFTLYYSDENKKNNGVVSGYNTVSLKQGDYYKHLTGLQKDKYYILSIKFENGTVVNKHFTTGFYYIKFNSGSAAGSMPVQKINYLKKTALTKNSFTINGDYKFSGWKAVKGKYTLGYNRIGKSGWYENPYKIRYLSDGYQVLKFGKFNETITLIAQFIPVAPSKNCYLTKDYKWIFVNKKISTDDNTLLRGIRKDIGAQKPTLCLQTAVTYAVYIMKDGKKPKYLDSCKSTRATGGQYSPAYTNMKDYYANIINSINKGLPVVLHVHWGGSNQHWITVTGYRRGISLDKMTFNDLFAIDPTPKYGIIYHNPIPKLVAPNMRVHTEHDMILWESKSKACYTGEC